MRHIMHRAAFVAALIVTGVSLAAWAYFLTRLMLDMPGVAWAIIGALFATGTIIGTYLDGELFDFQRGIAR